MINVLIVEDEPIYSFQLKKIVGELGYHTIGVTESSEGVMEQIKKQAPDLILMDIHIKGEISGIELSAQIQSFRKTPIIFITSFDDKATFDKAKCVGPSAYIIKPFDADALQRAMELAIENTYSSPLSSGEHNSVVGIKDVFIKSRNRLSKVSIEDILWIEVDDKYCVIHTAQKQFAIRKALKDFLGELNSDIFIQTHRSYAVNFSQIEDIDVSTFVVHLNGGHEIPLGKSYKDDVFTRLNIF